MNGSKIIAIAIAIVLISAGSFTIMYFESHGNSTRSKSNFYAGPRLNYYIYDNRITNLSSNVSRELSAINNTTIDVQVFGSYPDANKTYMLVNTSLNFFNGSIFLSPEFYNVSNAWASFISSHHLNMYPSLTVEAYENVYVNGSVYIYSYYNNIPFNPYALSVFTIQASEMYQNMTDKPIQALIAEQVLNGTGINPKDYNNITLTPYEMNASLSFSNRPIQVINASVFNGSGQPAVNPYCEEYSFNYYTYSYDTYDKNTSTTYLNGPFPIMIIHMSKNVSNGKSEISFGGSYFIVNGMMGIESDQAYKSNSGEVSTTMSSSPSYIHNVNISVSTESRNYDVAPINISLNDDWNLSQANNRTTGIVAITNATYRVIDYNQYTSEYKTKWHEIVYYKYVDGKAVICHVDRENDGTSYVGTSYDGSGYNLGITFIQTTAGNELNLVAELIPNQIAYGISYLMHSNASYEHYDLNTTGNSSSLGAATIEYDLSGYVDSSNAIKDARDALSTFSASLGLGLATVELIAALNDLDFDAGEAAIAIEAATLIANITGFAASILGDMSSIGFISDTEVAGVTYSISNFPVIDPGNNYVLSVMATGQPMTLNINGNTYSFYAPEDYINATSIIT